MKRLLNTLYVTSGNKYLSLDGENVVVLEEQKEIGRIPLHNLQAIITFGYTGASPALMGVCAQRNIDLSFGMPGPYGGGGKRQEGLPMRRQEGNWFSGLMGCLEQN